MIEIKVNDYTYSKVISGANKILPCLSFQSEFRKPGQYRQIRKEYRKSLIIRNQFLTGFIPRIINYCSINGIKLSVNDNIVETIEQENEPYIDGKDIRTGKWAYQYAFINKAIKAQRGVIKSATGTGKTIMMLGLISCFPSSKVLFLCNTYQPITQFKKGLKDHNIDPTNIEISTPQSYYKKKPKEYQMKHNMIIIDECHDGLQSKTGMYQTILKNSLAPMRFGFTATLPDSIQGKLYLEGYLGPVICELTMNKAIESGVLAKPNLILKIIPENKNLKEMTWRDAYDNGVVNNRALNRMIITDAMSDTKNNDTVLILVKEIEHGRNIVDMAKRLYDFDITFVSGSTGSDIREEIRQSVISKETKCIVATAVFKKALDIPNLGSVINGAGGKGEAGTIQAIGRGTRRVEGKDSFKIRDYFNPSNRYLVEHFGRRLILYFQEGWIKTGE